MVAPGKYLEARVIRIWRARRHALRAPLSTRCCRRGSGSLQQRLLFDCGHGSAGACGEAAPAGARRMHDQQARAGGRCRTDRTRVGSRRVCRRGPGVRVQQLSHQPPCRRSDRDLPRGGCAGLGAVRLLHHVRLRGREDETVHPRCTRRVRALTARRVRYCRSSADRSSSSSADGASGSAGFVSAHRARHGAVARCSACAVVVSAQPSGHGAVGAQHRRLRAALRRLRPARLAGARVTTERPHPRRRGRSATRSSSPLPRNTSIFSNAPATCSPT